MGLRLPPIPDDYGVGDDCLKCHPAGKSPNYVFVRFWDIIPCGANPAPPNGRTFICAKDPFKSCRYYGELDFGGYAWQCHYHSAVWTPRGWFGDIQLNSPDTPQPLFYFEEKAICSVSFNANLNTCPPHGGTDGHAHVQVFIPVIIILLTSHYHFVTFDDPLYEIQDVGMDHKLVHLAHRNSKTNVLIYLDDEEIEYES